MWYHEIIIEGFMTQKTIKTDDEWRTELTPEQFHITREKGTEPAFTGEFYNLHEHGRFYCVCCGAELFSSGTKFDSGIGWPSFWAPVSPDRVETRSDYTFGMLRTEVTCAQCDSHLGHVFGDGPAPTHLRFCINSAALKFVKEE